jgi:hypothetical protein
LLRLEVACSSILSALAETAGGLRKAVVLWPLHHILCLALGLNTFGLCLPLTPPACTSVADSICSRSLMAALPKSARLLHSSWLVSFTPQRNSTHLLNCHPVAAIGELKAPSWTFAAEDGLQRSAQARADQNHSSSANHCRHPPHSQPSQSWLQLRNASVPPCKLGPARAACRGPPEAPHAFAVVCACEGVP